jgi:two-component system response regulator FixJ
VSADPGSRAAVHYLLSMAKIDAETFETPTSFLSAYERGSPGCSLIVGLRFPDMDGLELLKRMADEGIEFPALVLTGYVDAALIARAKQAGALEVIELPFQERRLLQSVRHALEIDLQRRKERASGRSASGTREGEFDG